MPPAPKATEEASVPVKVKVFDAVRVFPSAIVNVEPVAGAVIVTLLIVVAVATPIVGVVRVGLVAKTSNPDPVSSLITPANCAEVVAAKNERLSVEFGTAFVDSVNVVASRIPASVKLALVAKAAASILDSRISFDAPAFEVTLTR